MASVDAFIVYNEQEQRAVAINHRLRRAGITTHFWREDIAPGEPIDDRGRLKNARVVVILLGVHGWGPEQLRLTGEALNGKKPIVPVVIGNLPLDATEQAGGLFKSLRYIDWSNPQSDQLSKITTAIRKHLGSPELTVVRGIGALVTGDDGERMQVLEELSSLDEEEFRQIDRILIGYIRDQYSPKNDDPKSEALGRSDGNASIRSWLLSALSIGASRSERARGVLAQHATPAVEPDRTVRFWVLHNLSHSMSPSSRHWAMKEALNDPAREVSLLAELHTADRSAWPNRLRELLRSSNIDERWAALRILRFYPEPTLVPDLCELLLSLPKDGENSELAYDVFCALGALKTSAGALPLLKTRFADVVELLVTAFVDPKKKAVQFVEFVALLNKSDLQTELKRLVANPQLTEAATRLRDELVRHERGQSPLSHQMPGYHSDRIEEQDDKLDIAQDVQGLAAVVASREVAPPLAIGLFGPWGSGKSFFMRAMRRNIEILAERAQERSKSPYVKHVVQIEFNAWHYVDTNLWASLVAHIFKQLSRVVTPEEDPRQKRVALQDQLKRAQQVVDSALAEKELIAASLRLRKEELDALRRQREERELHLGELTGTDLKSLLASAPDEADTVKQALDKLGLPKAMSSLADFRTVVSEAYSLRGRAAALVSAVLSRSWSITRILLTTLVLGGPILLAVAVVYLTKHEFLTGLSALLAEAMAVIAVIGEAVRKGSAKVRLTLDSIETARQNVESLYARKRGKPGVDEVKIAERVDELQKQFDATEDLAKNGAKEVESAQAKIKELLESTSLARFLSDRSVSEDYRKHLGLISTVRQDFETLADRLGAPVGDEHEQKHKPVERIVLYIDDLDRCPADKVVEVLQAVHLLLAYRLFVVVVGVDAQWLLHSLDSRYGAFKGDSKGPDHKEPNRLTMPQRYLEKIFQIPFNLRGMTAQGYSRLIGGLLPLPAVSPSSSVEGRADAREYAQSASNFAEAAVTSRPADSSARPRDLFGNATVGGGAGGISKLASDSSPESAEKEAELDFEIAEESLKICSWEAEYAADLYAFIPSPRAAKRLTNIYRLLKTRVAQRDLREFEGTKVRPGQFQLPLLLLAIMIHDPEWAGHCLPKIYVQWDSFTDVASALAFTDAQVEPLELRDSVSALVAAEHFPNDVSLLRDWIPHVARFSFRMNRLINSSAPRS